MVITQHRSRSAIALEAACQYEEVARNLPCQKVTILIDKQVISNGDNMTITYPVPISYVHDITKVKRKTSETVRLGPWLSALTKKELSLLFPHCSV